MKNLMLSIFVMAIAFGFGASDVSAQMSNDNPMVGGAAMYKNRDIVDNAVRSKDHTTLVAAVKAAGLVDTLKSKGPFTVFAPTDAAFNKGKATFKTVSGDTLTAMLEGSNVVLMDEKGGKSTVTTADVRQSNGIIHVIDSVVLPS